ncbi:MAG: hypothetical protein AAGI17_08910 [Planctomycetota bacterium]
MTLAQAVWLRRRISASPEGLVIRRPALGRSTEAIDPDNIVRFSVRRDRDRDQPRSTGRFVLLLKYVTTEDRLVAIELFEDRSRKPLDWAIGELHAGLRGEFAADA